MHPADLNLASQITGYGRFLFARLPDNSGDAAFLDALDDLGRGLENMHEVDGYPADDAWQRGRFQLLRAEPALGGKRDLGHPALTAARFLVRLEGEAPEPLLSYEQELRHLVERRGGALETLAGVQRPRSYTSYAMTQFAYASALPPGSGDRLPIGVVTPLSKSEAWWTMDWMRRESFFLPSYDAQGRMVAKGHALAAEAGIPHITRRLFHAPEGYGRQDSYDFIGYFEFAEVDAPIFHAVMTALRDVGQNPEWAYVREGPEWWGRRVGQANALLEKKR